MLDIYIQEVDGGYTLRIPIVPDKIQVSAATRFLDFDIMNTGPHKMPLGEELTGFRWEGILPGKSRANAPYVRAWMDPGAVQSKFSMWRYGGKKLRLMIPGTPVNHAVYLSSYQCDYSGGTGDTNYSVEFIAAKEVIVGTENSAAEPSSSGAGVKTTTPAAKPPAAKTYKVKPGDSLFKIAQRVTGDGYRWREVYDLNKDTIGSNPDKIVIGHTYNMPN